MKKCDQEDGFISYLPHFTADLKLLILNNYGIMTTHSALSQSSKDEDWKNPGLLGDWANSIQA